MRKWKPEDTPHFKPEELACRCGLCRGKGNAPMDGDFMEKLQRMRDIYAKPMKITSGYRCDNHPVEAKKTEGGAHNHGLAADIACGNAQDRYEIYSAALAVGMKGIYHKAGFVHVDDGHPHMPRPALW